MDQVLDNRPVDFQRGGVRGRDRGRGGDRGRGQPPARGSGNQGRAVDRIGRFPSDYQKCVTAGGEIICVGFQQGRCKK